MQRTGTVAVFGEALVDDFLTEQVVGGAPFNVARHLAAFGERPLTITRIGDDPSGKLVRAEFARFGMLENGLQIDARAETGRVIVERSAGQHRYIILRDQAYDRIDSADAMAAVARHAPQTLYFGTMAQRDSVSRGALHAVLRASDAQRYLDLNVRTGQVTERCVYESLSEADIVKVNEEELGNLLAWYTPSRHCTADMGNPEMVNACKTLLRSFKLQAMIVTLGERGVVHFSANGSVAECPASGAPQQLVDTVGAGDAFSAIYLLGRARGWPVKKTLARANEFAAAICGISGAVPGDLAFYAPFRANWLAD